MKIYCPVCYDSGEKTQWNEMLRSAVSEHFECGVCGHVISRSELMSRRYTP